MVVLQKVPGLPKSRTKTQWLAAIEVFLLVGMMGANFGWITPFLGRLYRPNPPFEATKEEISWVASVVSMSRILAIITGSITANYYGTKNSLYMSGFYYVGAWVSLICANSIKIVFFNQFCCGLGMGTLFTVYPLYLGEIVNPNIRGTIITFVANGFMVGLLYGNLMGSHTDPWIFGVINLMVAVIQLITFYFFPSSPYYLVNCNKLDEAEKAIAYYNNGADIKEEFDKLQDFIRSSPRVSLFESMRKLKEPANLKSFIVINVVYSLVQFSGTYAIIEYLEVIIMNGKIEIVLPSTLVTVMSAITIPSALVGMAIGDRFGRVNTLFTSCLVFCIAFIGWGGSFHLLESGFNPSDVQWLVIASALLFRINMTVGMTPIVSVLISEVFAPNVKSISSCLCNITSSLCIFISIKNFQSMVDHITFKYLFYLYAVLVLAVGFYTKCCIPETKGKTLQEIQEIFLNSFAGKNKKKQTNTELPPRIKVDTVCEEISKL